MSEHETQPPPPGLVSTTVLTACEPAASQLEPHPALVVRHNGATSVVDLPSGKTLRIGRAPDNDLVFEDPAISRHHARIDNADGVITVVDLESRNGVRVRGRPPLAPLEPLVPGDLVVVGPVEILVAGAAPRIAPRASASGATRASPAAGAAAPNGIIVADPAMIELYRTVRRLAALETTVLITGETGSGKEVVAEQLHVLSKRASGPFLRLNAAAVPEALLESELFGHERGAFTGADKRRDGFFVRADTGTLLLDEIAEMSPGVQAKLLRVLETRIVHAVGASTERHIDVRIIAATHRDLHAEVRKGRFREDLFYRISPFILSIPPLRERPEEIALLAAAFARRFTDKHELPRVEIHPSTYEALRSRAWPGNVRELRNAIEHALVLAEEGIVRPEHLPRDPVGEAGDASSAPPPPGDAGGEFRSRMAEAERRTLEAALRENAGNQSLTARKLGISRRALLYKMARYGIRVHKELK